MIEDPGIEIFETGAWRPATMLLYDSEFPEGTYADGFGEFDPVGLPWRLVSPMSSWTIDGKPLYPQSGVVGVFVESAAKIAGESLLTDRKKRRS